MGNGSCKLQREIPLAADPVAAGGDDANLTTVLVRSGAADGFSAPLKVPPARAEAREEGGSRKGIYSGNDAVLNRAEFNFNVGDDESPPMPFLNSVNGLPELTPLEAILGDDGTDAKYIKKRQIGKGAFGEAYIVQRNPHYDPAMCPFAERQFEANALAHLTVPGCLYVAKVIDLCRTPQLDKQYAQSEIICLAHTNHFGIIRYYEHYVLDSGDETMVIVTEFADHGDLCHNLNRSYREVSPAGLQLTEREAGMYFVQLLLALNHIHSKRVIHRDIKSANIFLTSHGLIKLGDFGFSQMYESTVSSETIARTFLGTPYYLSPEMWKGSRYGKKTDIWAAGIVLYEMLMNGRRPFEGMNLTELKAAVLSQETVLPEYPPDCSEHATGEDHATTVPAGESRASHAKFSSEMRALVQTILHKDPQQRPSAAQLLGTPIMQHYLFLFQRHVEKLCVNDAHLRGLAGSAPDNTAELAFPTSADWELVERGLRDGALAVEREMQRDPKENFTATHYEGVVFKGSSRGCWKERYLTLSGNALTISLSHAKVAANGGDRSKEVPLSLIKAVNRSQPADPHTQPTTLGTNRRRDYIPPYSFVVFMTGSSCPIYFGVQTAEELDQWMSVLMHTLQCD